MVDNQSASIDDGTLARKYVLRFPWHFVPGIREPSKERIDPGELELPVQDYYLAREIAQDERAKYVAPAEFINCKNHVQRIATFIFNQQLSTGIPTADSHAIFRWLERYPSRLQFSPTGEKLFLRVGFHFLPPKLGSVPSRAFFANP
jgi:hypothetical protein